MAKPELITSASSVKAPIDCAITIVVQTQASSCEKPNRSHCAAHPPMIDNAAASWTSTNPAFVHRIAHVAHKGRCMPAYPEECRQDEDGDQAQQVEGEELGCMAANKSCDLSISHTRLAQKAAHWAAP